MKPLLAHIYEPHRVTFPCYVQPKLNGIRALYKNGAFQSRDEVPFPPGLLDHLAQPLLQTFSPDVILDGELYVHGWPLQRINAAVTPVRQHPTEDTLKVEYHVFDVVDFGKSFHERLKTANQFNNPSPINYVPTWQVHNNKAADEYYAHFVSLGYEGMMYRLGDCPYTEPKQRWRKTATEARYATNANWVPRPRSGFLSDKDNRCWHLLKRKKWQDEDYIVTGVVEGEGKYQNKVGALKYNSRPGNLWMRDKLTGGGDPTVSGGLTDLQRQKFWDNPELIIGKTIKVKYLCLSSDGIPLNPTIEAIL